MKLYHHNLILLTLLLISSLGLAAWWSAQLRPLNNLSWKAIPPEIPALPIFDTAPIASSNQSLERPIFWESRRPQAPQKNVMPPIAAPVPMELLGIVSEGNQRVALLRPLQGTPPLLVRRMHQGESYNGMTIQRIDNDRVTLDSANGPQIIPLKRGSQNPNANKPAKLSAPQTIETTRSKLPDALQQRIDELKNKAAQQAQQPVAAPPP
jgi:hypothetical protein